MFERLRNERERRKIEKELTRRFKQAQLEHNHKALDLAIDNANFDLELLRWRIQRAETDRLCAEADRLDIEVPGDDASWEQTPRNGTILVTQARAELRRRIDAEKNRRREVKTWWWKTIILPALTALIGLTGAITGLVAILKK